MEITELVQEFERIVERHKLQEGQYARYLWNDAQGSRKMGINEYGCADAANILYTIGAFPGEPAERQCWIDTLKGLQEAETGLYREGTHHVIHTTAHCIAALELFDAYPDHPLTALMPYLEKEALEEFLAGLEWPNSPWGASHQGAGLFAAMTITRTADLEWRNNYFNWLRAHNDPETGLGIAVENATAPLCHQLFGWFHYFFNHEFAHMPIPNPEKVIDSCIKMYKEGGLPENFGKEVGFMEIDWIYAMNRASRQTPHRFAEVKALLLEMGMNYVEYLKSLDEMTDDGLNDLHQLFGASCALAELQIALPGEFQTQVPLKIVLDRRPFI